MAEPSFVATEQDIEHARKLGGVLTQEQLADFFGISVYVLRATFKRQPDFRAAYDRGRSATLGKVGRKLVSKALKGNVACMIFYMKTQAGWRETQRMEHTGADGGPIKTETAEEARREVMGRLVGISKRLREAGGPGGADGGEPGELEGPEVRLDVLGETRPASA